MRRGGPFGRRACKTKPIVGPINPRSGSSTSLMPSLTLTVRVKFRVRRAIASTRTVSRPVAGSMANCGAGSPSGGVSSPIDTMLYVSGSSSGSRATTWNSVDTPATTCALRSGSITGGRLSCTSTVNCAAPVAVAALTVIVAAPGARNVSVRVEPVTSAATTDAAEDVAEIIGS